MEWVVVTRAPRVMIWSDGPTEELLDDPRSAAELVAECARYCADPRAQAARDLPRSWTSVDGRRVATVDELERLVCPDRHPLMHLLCSQVVMGSAYECGATGLPDGVLLCECGRPMRTRVTTDRAARPTAVLIDKPMRLLEVATGRVARAALYVRVDLLGGTAQVGASRDAVGSRRRR